MSSLYYSALDIALIIRQMNLNCQDECKLLNTIWDEERAFLNHEYRNNQRKFLLDTQYWLLYLYDQELFDNEISAIRNDLNNHSISAQAEQQINEFSEIEFAY